MVNMSFDPSELDSNFAEFKMNIKNKYILIERKIDQGLPLVGGNV